tara:strand:+ start:346 stop:492 length:147 start_codon:yes stop_codon:yes gene_type:complete
MLLFWKKKYIYYHFFAGTPGNRTQLCSPATDSGFEGRGEHQLLNHSQA